MSAVAARLRSWQRWVLGVGPITLAALFLVRATVPVIDTLLLGIFVVLAAGTVALIAGSRIGAGVVLALSLALFQPITAREFSFSLTAIDSDVWRAWAIASAISIGWWPTSATNAPPWSRTTGAARLRGSGPSPGPNASSGWCR